MGAITRRSAAASAVVGALLLASLSAGTGGAASNEASEGFFVVRFDRRITDPMRARLVATGAAILGYEPTNSYVVWASEEEAAAARRLEVVAKVDTVPPGRKLGVAAPKGSHVDVDVTVYGPHAPAARSALARLGTVRGMAPLDARGDLATISMTVASDRLRELAARRDVLYIEPALRRLFTEDEMTAQIASGHIGDDKRAVTGYLKWLKKVKLSGKGIRLAIVDTGIHESHHDLAGRVVETIDYGTERVQEPPYDIGGHGTHVAGIAAGSPSSSGSMYADPDGFLYGMGMAPEAELINQNLLGFFAPGTRGDDNHIRFRRVAKDAFKADAHVWNSSWHTGQGSRAGYLASVRVFDELARDVLPRTPRSEEFLFVFSAGNAGASGPTVPKEAKNLIAVGSTMSGRGLHWPLTSNPETVSASSSQGPTKDGRIFPTVSAPGGYVISARAIEGSASLACATPVDGFAYYCQISGTSMAAPHVTGAAGLIQQWWKREHGVFPSPAIVKALLVNTATDIGEPDIPNIFEGWGRINLGRLFAGGPQKLVDQSVRFTARGQAQTYTVASDGKAPLKVTVAWSDAPATVGAEKVLVNDLDLIVERIQGGGVVETYRGNVFTAGRSKSGGKPDRLNNLENVYLLDPKAGTYRITIEVANLPGDGVPNNSDKTDQDFALVIRGAR